tara:strand:+ start:192 stop:914 length:723 start_codon:yes stop_codon:yes gene_type:complete
MSEGKYMNYDINKFAELGYLIVTDFLTKDEHFLIDEECNKFSKYGIRLFDNRNGWVINSRGNPCKMDAAMDRSTVFRGLGSNETLKGIAQKLLDQEHLDTYISKFFPMVPRVGFSVGWHQDNHYIKADPDKLVSCDVFVNGADKNNGCLRILPKSHLEEHEHLNRTHGMFDWICIDEEDSSIIDIECDTTFAVFFHPNLVHGCYRNKSDRYRYSIAWEYIHEGYVPKTHSGHQSQDRLPI